MNDSKLALPMGELRDLDSAAWQQNPLPRGSHFSKLTP